MNKEGFKRVVKAGRGQLAAEAKREECKRLMRQKKKTPATKADEVLINSLRTQSCRLASLTILFIKFADSSL